MEKRQKLCSHERLERTGTLAHGCPCHRSAEMVQNGEKLGMYIETMLHCSTLKPESRPHHISFHHLDIAKGVQQKGICIQKMTSGWVLRRVSLSCGVRSSCALRLPGTESCGARHQQKG